MRKVLTVLTVGAATLLLPAAPAAATHTGCEHARTGTAHQRVPHRNEGTHRAHSNIPYCPPEDAPRQ